MTLEDYRGRIRRAFNLPPDQDPERPVAVLSMENQYDDPVESPGLAIAGTSVNGGGATLAELMLENPADSGVDIVVEFFRALATTGPINVGEGVGAGATTSADWADFRRTGQPSGRLRTQAVAARSGALLVELSQSTEVLPGGFVIAPGAALIFTDATVNESMRITIWWRERLRGRY